MPLTEKDCRDAIVDVGRRLSEKGWVASNDGNISIRLEDDRILATPTAVSKGALTPGQLIVCDLEGQRLEGNLACTTEIGMHLCIYKLRPDVKAVVHAHPPVATGFAVAGRPLNLALIPEVVVGLGSIPLADYGLPGTAALTEGMKPYIPKYDALLMANHGAVTYGDSVYSAFYKMETLEHFARITLVSQLLGGPKVLPREEVEKLFEARTRYGVKVHSGLEPGAPLMAEDMAAAENERISLTRRELTSIIDEAVRKAVAAALESQAVRR